MNLPNRREILEEATKLFFQRNKEVECFNTPERYELQEEGLLAEARNRLMRNTVEEEQFSVEKRTISNSVIYMTEVKNMEKQDWVSQWMKKDPYMMDIEGFEKFVKEKEKELRVQITVDLCSDLSTGQKGRGFLIWVEVPSNQIPPEQKNEAEVAKKEAQVQTVANQIEELLKQLGKTERNGEMNKDSEGLRPGSIHVFMQPPLVCKPELCIADIERRKTRGEYSEEALWWKIMKEEWNNCEWVFYGDEVHCGEENIHHNAKILWQIWNAIGKLVPTCYGIGKPYQCDDIYLYCYEDIPFPPFSTTEASVLYILKDNYNEEIRSLKIETTELDEIGMQLNELGKALFSMNIPNTENIYQNDFIWILGEQPLPILSMMRDTVPEVLEYLSTGEECWDPENDWDLDRNGGIEMIHPFLRRELKLKWTEDDVVWSERAEEYRTLFYTRFTDSELAAKTVEQLSAIASAKGIHGHNRKQDLIDAILKANDKTIVKPMQPPHNCLTCKHRDNCEDTAETITHCVDYEPAGESRTDRPPSMRYTPPGQTFNETGWTANWDKGVDEPSEIVGKTVADIATGQTGICIRRRQTPLGSVVQVEFKFTDDSKWSGEILWFWEDEVQMLDV